MAVRHSFKMYTGSSNITEPLSHSAPKPEVCFGTVIGDDSHLDGPANLKMPNDLPLNSQQDAHEETADLNPFAMAKSHSGLLAILVVSLSLNLWNASFPVGYHGDEPKKVRFILDGIQDFHHPILLLQLSRIGNLICNFDDWHVVLVGRCVSAIAGMLTVLMTWTIARRFMTDRWACFAAISVAVSPILVVHSHYLKEDVLFTACVIGTLWAWSRFAEHPGWKQTIWLGALTGLACASHYKAALLGPLSVILFLSCDVTDRRRHVLRFLAASVIAGYVFFNVNFPILEDPQTFVEGVLHEKDHALDGHSLRIHAKPEWFLFHFRNSLMPGLTPMVAIVAAISLIALTAYWRSRGTDERMLILFTVVYYIVPELSPSKPAPDYGRYVLQIAPCLILLMTRGLQFAINSARSRWLKTAIALFAGCCVAVPLGDTILLCRHLLPDRDTREQAAEKITASGGSAIFEQYATAEHDVRCLGDFSVEDLRNQGHDFAVASSFRYERFFRGSRMADQDEWVYERHRRYVELFALPYVELRPEWRSYGFSNPVIRIVDLRQPTVSSDSSASSSVD